MNRARVIIWIVLVTAAAVPIGLAATSPLLEWRDPVYIIAGITGVIALALMLFQPLLSTGHLPGIKIQVGRRIHRWLGSVLVVVVVIHVAGLWITSPPDVIDAFLFRSPTPFSFWGVLAMWALFVSAFLVSIRQKLKLRTWRLVHKALAVVIVVGTVLHAILIEGTMETVSKWILCVLLVVATLIAMAMSQSRIK